MTLTTDYFIGIFYFNAYNTIMQLLMAAYIGVAYFLIRYFMRNDRGSKEPSRALWQAAGYGAMAVVLAIIVEAFVIPADVLPRENYMRAFLDLRQVFIASMMVGIVEEAFKFIPLALHLYKKPYFNEVTDGIIYFGIAGLSFGLIENIGYSLAYSQTVGLLRIILTPFLHVGFVSIIGLTLALHKVAHKSWLYVLVGFVIGAGLHGLYDFGLFSGKGWYVLLSGILAIIVNFIVFILFKHARRIDEGLGISATGNNRFCRNCGKQNIRSTLYCEYCGNKT